MKKKIAGLNSRVQIGAVVVLLLIFGFVARSFVVSPQGKKAAAVQTQIDAVTAQTAVRRAQLRAASKPAPIKVADLFKLSKAMPDRADMPGIILTISDVARQAGIHFDTIEPEDDSSTTPPTNYKAQRLHLVFKGDFYALSDFLYRLRSLVAVRQGRLDAMGRLFAVQNLTLNVEQNKFPAIGADLHVNAYQYGSGTTTATTAPPTTTAVPTTTTTTPTTAPTDSASPDGATAAGAIP